MKKPSKEELELLGLVGVILLLAFGFLSTGVYWIVTTIGEVL